jgi:hypothetical protein
MKQATKENTAALIDGLASKELSFGCRIKHNAKGELVFISEKYCQKPKHDSENGCSDSDYCNNLACLDVSSNKVIYGNTWAPYEILGHPILIGDVLERLKIHDGFDSNFDFTTPNTAAAKLIYAWYDFGLDTHLQSIAESIEWVDPFPHHCDEHMNWGTPSECWLPKQKEIRELIEFLINLNL